MQWYSDKHKGSILFDINIRGTSFEMKCLLGSLVLGDRRDAFNRSLDYFRTPSHLHYTPFCSSSTTQVFP